MKHWKNIMLLGSVFSLGLTVPAMASTNLETGSSLAGISVALNNYYAGNEKPEQQFADRYDTLQSAAVKGTSSGEAASAGQAGGQSTSETAQSAPEEASQGNSQETAQKTKTQSSAYDNIAVSKISGTVNIRTEANTSSTVTGKINNDCAATILETVEGEGGNWYKIKSGSVTGYIKAEYFVTGQEAETRAREVGTTYGTVVGTSSLRLRQDPDLTSKTLTLLAEGADYTVIGEEGDFLKVAVDSDLEGYVFKEYMKTDVQFKEAVSLEEEKTREEEEAKRKEEADKALKELEEAKRQEAQKKTTEAARETEKETTAKETTVKETTTKETTAKETTAKETSAAAAETTQAQIQTIAANPEKAEEATVEAPSAQKPTETVKPTEKPTEKTTEASTAEKGPGSSDSSDKGSSGAVTSATRNAIVAYAKQFLGNPYVYGGTSLTNGADCSGFTMKVFSHFGISTGRSSRDQAARGKAIPIGDVQPGDLLFYASGDYINHVGIYIGGGQIIHASNPSTGICLAPSNYRTPCKAVTFLD